MGLPKLDVPVHEVEIPSTKQTIRVRPFLVKEQKLLLMGMASENTEEIVNATKQVVNNCIISENFDIDKLELFDLEYLILQLRILSVGETTKISFLPRQNIQCKECSRQRDVEINLKDAIINFSSSVEKKISLTDKVGVIMKYPTAKIMGKIQEAKATEKVDDMFKIMWMCVDSVYDEESITASNDVSLDEGVQFLESLNANQFLKIEKFMSSIPKLEQKIHIKCSECSFEEDFILSGLDNFFD